MRSLQMRVSGSENKHRAPVTSVALKRGSALMASTSYDGSVIIWDLSDPDAPLPVSRVEHRRLTNSATWNPFAPTILATASADKTVAVWDFSDLHQPRRISVLARHTDDINSVAWLPDGERLVAVSEDGRASLWNAVRGTFEGFVGAHAAHCMMVDVSRHGLIATVGEDGLVAVHDLRGQHSNQRTYASSVEGCAWSNDGTRLALARDDGSVDVLTAELDVVFSTKVATSAARSVAWSDADGSIVVGAYDGGVHLLSPDGELLVSTRDERFWPRSVSVAGDVVAVGSFGSEPHLLSVRDLAVLHAPKAPTFGVNAVALDGDSLLLGDDAGRVLRTALDCSEAVAKSTMSVRIPSQSPVLSLASHNGVAWAGTYGGFVVQADGSSRSKDLDAPIPSLLALPDALIAGTYNGELVELDPHDLSIRRRRDAYDGSIKALALLPGGNRFVSASTDRVVGLGTFSERAVLWEHGNLVNAVAVSSDGQMVASASRDHTIKLGVLAGDSPERVTTLLAPDESVKAVAVLGTAENPIVIAGSYDFGVYAWKVDWSSDAISLKEGMRLKYMGQGVSSIIALDQTRAVVVGWDGSLVHYEVDGETVLEVADLAIEELAPADAA